MCVHWYGYVCTLVCVYVSLCVLAVVVTMYGIVDPKTGMVINLVNLGAAMRVSVYYEEFLTSQPLVFCPAMVEFLQYSLHYRKSL